MEDVEEAAGDRLVEDERPDLVGQPGQRAQLGDVERVLHEPDVEDEVGLERQAVLEPEADELDRELVGADRRGELGEQALAQLAQREVRGVEHDVGLAPDGVEQLALLGDRARDPARVRERMPVAGLAEAADQDLVAGLEVDDARPDAATLERSAHRREREVRVTRADVEHDGDAGEALAVRGHELGQVRQQLARQVVDDGVAEVLEQLGRGGLAAAGQAAHDHDGRLRSRLAQGPRLRLAGQRPERRMNRTVSSNSRNIVPPRTNGLTRSPPGVATAEKIGDPEDHDTAARPAAAPTSGSRRETGRRGGSGTP